MTLKELVKGKKVRFRFYRDGEIWYATDGGFEFPVPIADTGTGVGDYASSGSPDSGLKNVTPDDDEPRAVRSG